ncbi:MAG: WG repeat-containing protein [Clostridiales bacterium]|nr:WG repeat-containing protein [Clostridiales bacterium]
MKFARVLNAAALFLIVMLLSVACMPAETPTAASSGSFAPTGEATFTAKPTAASTVRVEETPRPIEKLNVFVRRVELPKKTDGMLLPCYIMEQNGWGYANERGEILLGTEYSGYSKRFFWNGYMAASYCGAHTDGMPVREVIVNSRGEAAELADYDALSEFYEENGKYYCDGIFVEGDHDNAVYYRQGKYLFAAFFGEKPMNVVADLDGNVLFVSAGELNAIEYLGEDWILSYYYEDDGSDNREASVKNACFVNLITGVKTQREDIDFIDLNFSSEGRWPRAYGKYRESGELEFGFVGRDGKDVIAPQFAYALSFSEGCAAVRRKGEQSWIYIGLDAKPLFEQTFAAAEPFSEGLAAAGLDGKTYGYIDKTGEFVIPPVYDCAALQRFIWEAWVDDRVRMFYNGYALVADAGENRLAYIDKTGKELFHFFAFVGDYD